MSQDKGGKGSQDPRRQGMSQYSTSQNIFDEGDATVCFLFLFFLTLHRLMAS